MSKNALICIILSALSSARSFCLHSDLLARGLYNTTDQGWANALKEFDDASKQTRTTHVEQDRLLSAKEYAQIGYLKSLASKGNFTLDLDAEVEARTTVSNETVSYDPYAKKFTVEQAFRDQAAFQTLSLLPPKSFERAIDFWQRRQIWTAAGSATGYKPPKTCQDIKGRRHSTHCNAWAWPPAQMAR